jgi:hypothetical protein
LAIVLSRETGARGRSIAERVAELLGWDYIDQESLEYLTQGPPSGSGGKRDLEAAPLDWVDRRMTELTEEGILVKNPEVTPLVRGVLEAAVVGRRVILGRGAGRVLPAESRLHVKIVAPLELRIAVIAQMRRLSSEQAAQYIREKDRSREEFLAAKLGVDPNDLSQYDLVVNTAHFGVDASAEIVALAAQEKEKYIRRYE